MNCIDFSGALSKIHKHKNACTRALLLLSLLLLLLLCFAQRCFRGDPPKIWTTRDQSLLCLDEMLSEFRECFQKTEDDMEICRICWNILWKLFQNSLKFPKPNKLFIIRCIISFASLAVKEAKSYAPCTAFLSCRKEKVPGALDVEKLDLRADIPLSEVTSLDLVGVPPVLKCSMFLYSRHE